MNNPTGQVGGYPNPNLPNFNNGYEQPYVSNTGYNSQQQIPPQPQQPFVSPQQPQQFGFDTPQQFPQNQQQQPQQQQMKGDPNCSKCKGTGMKFSKKKQNWKDLIILKVKLKIKFLIKI